MAKKFNLIYSPPWDILMWPNSQSPFASSPCQTFQSLAPAFPTETLSSRCVPSGGRLAPLQSARSTGSSPSGHGAAAPGRALTPHERGTCWREPPNSPPGAYLLLQMCSAQRHPLLQLLEFSFMLCFCLHLNFALVRVEELHLLLELQSQGLAFRFLSLVQPEL